MSDAKKLFNDVFKDLLAPIPAAASPKVTLNPRAYLDAAGLEDAEQKGIEDAESASELSHAFQEWAVLGRCEPRGFFDPITDADVIFIRRCRQLLEKSISFRERLLEDERALEGNEADLYEEHA